MVKEGEGSREESRWHFNGQQVESLYLHINDREDDGRLVVNYDYRTDLFYAKEIDFLHEHLIQLLWHALDNPARKISEIHMLGEKEKQKVLETFNDTDSGYPRTATIGSLFAEQVRLRPDAPALVHGARTLTYRELDAKANRLANRLRASGVGPETLVALLLPRTPELVIGILGVVKAGGAYLPLDPEYPADRLSFMLEDSRTRHLVSCVEFLEGFPFDGDRIDLFALLDEPAVSVAASIASATPGADPDDAPPDVNGPDDLLYVIYTSGTTGRPKGAQIVHKNVVRLLFNDRFAFDFGPEDRWTLFHSYCFDFSVWEMYGALLCGGTLVVVPRDIARDTGRFLDLLVRERITILNQTPAAFYNLVDAVVREGAPLLALRTVVFGGDALKPALLKPFRIRYPKTKLVNMYGITETTVHVTYLELTDADLDRGVSNVGRPIPTTRTYILDRKLNPQPIGIPGELCVGGDGVGRGYLNNPDLTGTKFVPDPFVPGGLLYRSGDLARYFPQGDIEYLGRIDTQVKIRGHRIELGEIESGLLRFDRISKAAVVALETADGGRRLCAYLVPTASFETGELRTFLARFLPDYMVPALFVRLDDIPLNGNGKLDRARLPVPEADEADTEVFLAPRTELESWIAGVWCDALKIARIGVDDDFFQSGGDSLNAVVAISQLNGRASFGDLYRNPTVARLAEAIARKETEGINDQLLLKLSGTESRGGAEHTNIVCFPYGGGNAGIYKDLADAVARRSSTTSVYAVDLPGRLAVDPAAPSLEPRLGGRTDARPDSGLICESASAEPLRGTPRPGAGRIPASALRDNESLAEQLADEIRAFVAGEVIVYGHCVGNALALETVRRLRSLGVPVRAFYAGAILPPANPKRIRRGHDPWRHVPDSGILAVLGHLGLPHCELGSKPLKALLRAFRFDVRAYYRFFRERGNEKPLDVPVHSVFGGSDPFTYGHRTRHRRWSRYAETFSPVVLDGASHYFMKTHPEQLAGILVGEMANDPPTPPAMA
jgi:amino acid adenylation domain-containing protein